MPSQADLQSKGEQFIGTIYRAIVSSTGISFDQCSEPRERLVPSETYLIFSLATIRSLIFDEFHSIFKIGTSEKDSAKIVSYLDNFIMISHSMNEYKRIGKRKQIAEYSGKYNKWLSRILQHIQTTKTENKDIREKISYITQMQLYNNNGLFDGVDRTPQVEEIPGREIPETETRFQNYDGWKIMSSYNIIMRIPRTKIRNSSIASQGVVFGFDTANTFFDMMCASVEKATVRQLKSKQVIGQLSDVYGGSLIHDRTIFYIDLVLKHGIGIDAIIESSSNKIIAQLCYGQMTHKSLRKIFTSALHIGAVKSLGLYLKYHNLVTKKIYELINASFAQPNFPYICIECYRPECNGRNIYIHPIHGHPTNATCNTCMIAEFCIGCGKVSHVGACDSTPDARVDENTKICPGCHSRVEKDGGCNHISCPCGTHFCWLCNASYELDQINDHYSNLDPYARCIGIQPIEG